MSKKRNYEWDRRVRLGELLRREGELPSSQRCGRNFSPRRTTPGPANGELRKVQTTENFLRPPDPPVSAKSSTSSDSMAILPAKTSNSTSESVKRRRQGQELFLRATDTPISRLPGISIYYTNAPTSHSHAPHTFSPFSRAFPSSPFNMYFPPRPNSSTTSRPFFGKINVGSFPDLGWCVAWSISCWIYGNSRFHSCGIYVEYF